MSEKSKCEICHEKYDGCCTDEIFLTIHDALRVANYLKKDIDEIACFSEASKELREVNEDSKDFLPLLENGKILQFKHDNEEDCCFLTKDGCTIFSARPFSCRIMPFWYEKTDDEKFKLVLSKADKLDEEFCVVCRDFFDADDVTVALKDIGETSQEMEKAIRDHLEEMKLYKEYLPMLIDGAKPSDIVKKYNIKV